MSVTELCATLRAFVKTVSKHSGVSMAASMCERWHCTARCAAVVRADSKLYRDQVEATQCLEALPNATTLLEAFTTVGVHSKQLEAAA